MWSDCLQLERMGGSFRAVFLSYMEFFLGRLTNEVRAGGFMPLIILSGILKGCLLHPRDMILRRSEYMNCISFVRMVSV